MPRQVTVTIGTGTALTQRQLREALVLGTDKPASTNTGPYPGVPLTTATSASQLVATDGTTGLVAGRTYENWQLDFIVQPPTGDAPITFRNFRSRGPAAAQTGDVGLFKLYDPGHCPVKLYDGVLDPQTPSRWLNGLHGYRFEAYRLDISRVIDGCNVFRPAGTGDVNGALDVTVEQCWLHDSAWYPNPPETRAVDGSHSDTGAQLQGGSGFRFRGNTVEGFNHPDFPNTYYDTEHANAGLMIKPDVGLITDMLIERNWLDGGAFTVNFSHDGPARFLGTVGALRQNLFGRNPRQGSIIRPTSTPIVCDFGSGPTANQYADTLTTVPLSNGG